MSQKAATESRLELLIKRYKEVTRELDEMVFQLAVISEELKRKEKKLEERLVEVMALCSLQRQQKLTCLLASSSAAIRHSRS